MARFETNRTESSGIVDATKGAISFSGVGRGWIPVARSIVDFTLQGERDDACGEKSNVEGKFFPKRICK